MHDVYHRGVIVCSPDTPLLEVIRVMADMSIHAVVVVEQEGGSPVGVVSHANAITHYGEDLTAIQARDVMTAQVVAVPEDATLRQAAQQLVESRIHRLLVVNEGGEAVGVLSTTDMIREMRGDRWIWHAE